MASVIVNALDLMKFLGAYLSCGIWVRLPHSNGFLVGLYLVAVIYEYGDNLPFTIVYAPIDIMGSHLFDQK